MGSVRATQQTECLTEQQIRSRLRPMLTKSVYGEGKIRQFWRELVTDCKFKDARKGTQHMEVDLLLLRQW